jgi:hypothetical protein
VLSAPLCSQALSDWPLSHSELTSEGAWVEACVLSSACFARCVALELRGDVLQFISQILVSLFLLELSVSLLYSKSLSKLLAVS